MPFRPLVLAGLPLILAAQAPSPMPPAGAPAQALKPFADVVKEAKETPGLFPLWRKEDKVYLELRPEQLDQPFFFSVSSTQGLGERGVYGGMMDRTHVVAFHRVGNTLQFLAKNLDYRAPQGSPAGRAVAEGFSDSLLAAAPVLCQPHPERKTILVEANALFINDLPMGATQLEATYRQPYMFDKGNSSFEKVRNTEDMLALTLKAHYNLPKLMLPPLMPPGAPPMVTVPPPGTVEDLRSLFLGWHFSLAKLPDPMAPRLVDERVGYFASTYWDFSNTDQPNPRVRLVNRWRLEKKDPAAALSEPVKPITYWLDRNIPEKFRAAVKAGILEWNKAFEKVGFKDAVRVEVQPDDAEWDTHDVRHASVRWLVGTDIGFAIGPSHVDPRTGEILDADIGLGESWARGPRQQFTEQLPKAMDPASWKACAYADTAHQEMSFAMDLLEARGDLAPNSPEADAFVNAVLKDVISHEVGHTLGLRHNFRASTIHALDKLQDAAFTREHGLTGSVMDYNALNLAAKGEKQGEYFMSTLGPYDYWAIEYGYRPFPADQEKTGLAAIANRSAEPQLAFATDQEAGFGGMFEGMDPDVNRRDLGSDPLAFYRKRVQLSRELWDRLQTRDFAPGESYDVLRRNFSSGLGQLGLSANLTAKYVGGVVYVRDHAGTGRAPFTPVAAERQRQALKLLQEGLFSPDSFRFKAEFMSRLTVNQLERGWEPGAIAPDYSLSTQLTGLQRFILGQLMAPAVHQRILDSGDKLADPKAAFRLSELFDGLQGAIWSEARQGKEITPLRRNLQREHLKTLVNTVLRANPATPADARSLAREALRQMQPQLKAALLKPLSKESKAHLQETLATVEETLKAQVVRTSL